MSRDVEWIYVNFYLSDLDEIYTKMAGLMCRFQIWPQFKFKIPITTEIVSTFQHQGNQHLTTQQNGSGDILKNPK